MPLVGDANGDRLARLALFLLCLRLLTWAFLLPPWSGFDEPYHHGLVETYAEDMRWHPFLSVTLPLRLLESMRRWPLFSGYANAFAARTYGEDRAPDRPPVQDRNYETLQSPTYYFLAGLVLRILPRIDPSTELFLLRILNAILAAVVGRLTLKAARLAGFGRRAAYPVILLALLPGFALALVRVSNDALCAVLISVAIFASIRAKRSGDRSWLAAGSAGLAPWTKLYGWAAIPKIVWDEIRRRPRALALAARLGVLVVPGIALSFLSWRINGHPVSLLENLQNPGSPRVIDVPWVKDFWTIVKTQIWLSGMSNIVFPTMIYLIIASAFAYFLWAAFRPQATCEQSSELIPDLVVPVVFFGLALVYFSYRNFALYRGPGGTGGWYLWSMALPESLLLTWAAARAAAANRALRVVLIVLFALTIAGDTLLFAEPSGRILVTLPAHHLRGLAPAPLLTFSSRFLTSRPRWSAWAAVVLAVASWITGFLCLTRAWRTRQSESSAF